MRKETVMALCLACTFAASTKADELHLMTQCRILDTREIGTGSKPATGTNYGFDVRGDVAEDQGGTAGCSVPDDATGVMLNITVTGGLGAGYVEAFPYDNRPSPPTSRLNYAASQTIANEVLVPLAPEEEDFDIALRPEVAQVHLIADLVGYTLAPAASSFSAQGVVVSVLGDGNTPYQSAFVTLRTNASASSCSNADDCVQVECQGGLIADCFDLTVTACARLTGRLRKETWTGSNAYHSELAAEAIWPCV